MEYLVLQTRIRRLKKPLGIKELKMLVKIRDLIREYFRWLDDEPGAVALVCHRGEPLAEILVKKYNFVHDDYAVLEEMRALATGDEELFDKLSSERDESEEQMSLCRPLFYDFEYLDQLISGLEELDSADIVDSGYLKAIDLLGDRMTRDELLLERGQTVGHRYNYYSIGLVDGRLHTAANEARLQFYKYLGTRKMMGGVLCFFYQGKPFAVMQLGDEWFAKARQTSVVNDMVRFVGDSLKGWDGHFLEIFTNDDDRVIGGITSIEIVDGLYVSSLPLLEMQAGWKQAELRLQMANQVALRTGVCPYCGVVKGQLHKRYCFFEECPNCDQPMIECRHCFSKEPLGPGWNKEGDSYYPSDGIRKPFGTEKIFRSE